MMVHSQSVHHRNRNKPLVNRNIRVNADETIHTFQYQCKDYAFGNALHP